MSVTINDVAQAAGVSASTVSKVINGWTTISPATTARVQAAIESLHYVPNQRAVSFAKGATKNITFLTSINKSQAYKNPHMFEILCGAYSVLSKYNYTVSITDTSADTFPGESIYRIIKGGSCDGIIVHGSALTKDVAANIVASEFPHTIIGNPSYDTPLCWVDTNHVLGGQFAADHLLAKGYTEVGFIGGRKSDFISSQRLKGLRQTMLKSGNKMSTENIIYSDHDFNTIYNHCVKLLTSKSRPQAIVCENCFIAVVLQKAIERLSLSTPDDIAFLTFDKYPYTSTMQPTPTIVDIDVYDLGVQAGSTLARKLENPKLLVQSYTTLPLLIQGATT